MIARHYALAVIGPTNRAVNTLAEQQFVLVLDNEVAGGRIDEKFLSRLVEIGIADSSPVSQPKRRASLQTKTISSNEATIRHFLRLYLSCDRL